MRYGLEPMMKPGMHDRILSELSLIEQAEGVRIVFACESGSRAWGLSSAHSDFDVRFLYIRPSQDYLRLDEPRDVIERPLSGNLDINGWDLRKALKLLHKSNPTLMEWLGSPMVYREVPSITQKIRNHAAQNFQPLAAHAHYFHMAKSQFKSQLQRVGVPAKQYIHALRCVFAMIWIETGMGLVPVDFQAMIDRLTLDPLISSEILRLIELKRQGADLDPGGRNDVIHNFLEQEIRHREQNPPDLPKIATHIGLLNEIFLESLAIMNFPDTAPESHPRQAPLCKTQKYK